MCFGISFYSKAVNFGVSLSPIFRHYEMKPMFDAMDNSYIPWSNSFKIGVQLQHFEGEKYCFYSSLSYNSGRLSLPFISPIDSRICILSPGKMHIAEYAFLYSYDIQLSKRIYLNPEIGVGIQFPFILKDDNTTIANGINENYNSTPPPVVAANANLWLKFELNHNHTLKAGFCGNLPFYRTQLGTYTVNNDEYAIKSGLGYMGIGLSYLFQLNK